MTSGLADEIIAGKVTTLDPKQKVIANAFYALWWARAEHRTAGADPISFKNVTGHGWTKDQEEDFEKHGVSFIREGGAMPDRFLRGFRIQSEIDRLLPDLSSAKWGIMRAQAGASNRAGSCGPTSRSFRLRRRFASVGDRPES